MILKRRLWWRFLVVIGRDHESPQVARYGHLAICRDRKKVASKVHLTPRASRQQLAAIAAEAEATPALSAGGSYGMPAIAAPSIGYTTGTTGTKPMVREMKTGNEFRGTIPAVPSYLDRLCTITH